MVSVRKKMMMMGNDKDKVWCKSSRLLMLGLALVMCSVASVEAKNLAPGHHRVQESNSHNLGGCKVVQQRLNGSISTNGNSNYGSGQGEDGMTIV